MQATAKEAFNFRTPHAIWSSAENLAFADKFWRTRQIPSLPLLKREQDYELVITMEATPTHTVMVEIIFRDRFGELVGRRVTAEGRLQFTYPDQAYAYEVRLLSAGLQEFTFHYFTIQPISSEGAEVLA
ncbi:MAG: accessory Sec system protein Asp3 [Streptococcus sp.]